MTYTGIQRDDSDSVVGQSDSQEPGALLARRNAGQSHADHVGRHLLPLCVLVQLTRLQRKDICIKNVTACSLLDKPIA